jgi:hypothetical protein
MVPLKSVLPDTRDTRTDLVTTGREIANPAPSSLMSIPAWQSEVASPSDEKEPNAPYFVKALGYGLLAMAATGIVWSAAFSWFRHGGATAADMLSWGGRLSPLVITAFIGPAVALILIGTWMQRRVDRRSSATMPTR